LANNKRGKERPEFLSPWDILLESIKEENKGGPHEKYFPRYDLLQGAVKPGKIWGGP